MKLISGSLVGEALGKDFLSLCCDIRLKVTIQELTGQKCSERPYRINITSSCPTHWILHN